ncbi:MAG: MFS transporter [Bacilli bacterium]|nr:MFS transporter [Bacilli bacterium]
MKEYFYKREYKYMYLSKLSYSLGKALIEGFGTVMLYKNGIPIWLILLIYGIRFGIMGVITPLFISISSRLGIAKCILISNIFSILSSFMILEGKNLYSNIIIFIVIMGLNGLSNPSSDALSSRYVETKHRGRYNSFLNVSNLLGTALSSCLVAWGVITNNNMILFIFIAFFFLLQYVFIKQIDYKPENKTNAFKATMKYILKSKSKYKIIYALRTNHILERLFVSLYLYIMIEDFKLFSSITIISMFLQVLTIILVGKYSDKNIKKSNDLVTIIKTAIIGIFLITKNKVIISINKTLNDNFQKVYETSTQTSIQNIIKESKEDNELLSAVGQMTLCFTEIIIFGVLALISKFIGEKIFIIIFILSIISTILINVNIKQSRKAS